MALPSGEELYVTIDQAAVDRSAHAQAGITCGECHTDITTYPHRETPVQNLRDVPEFYSQVCGECHEEVLGRYAESVHAQIRASGEPGAENAATCSDCHNPHYQPLAEKRSNIVATCARCHSAVAQEYRTSVHGEAVMESENADVPLCIDCHGVHTIEDPRTAEWLNESPELCARCHTDPQRMAPYDLNTNVLNTYVADFHGTTSVLFQKQTPDQAPNTPLCIDCHGIHNIRRTDDPASTVMQENLLATCQKCHPDATANFSAAWLSHYTPSPDRHPLVYFVGLFYTVFIPAVLIPMAIFVATDIWRLVRQRRSQRPTGGEQ
jgi:nitrate/TMAO reductase-like tetraheme cytochrome c subunit